MGGARTLTIDLDTAEEPISGRIRSAEDGSARSFVGYLQLVAALEALRAGTDAQPAPPTDTGSAKGEKT